MAVQDRLAAGPLSVEEALRCGRQIADALEAAHEQGVVHRDLKPANIKIRSDGTVKVLDFGIAKILSPTEQLRSMNTQTVSATEQGALIGTMPYMSPEQARGAEVTRRSDVWAFGAILFEMLTGKRAFTVRRTPMCLRRFCRGPWT
jgi:serine/threonine-protein kinase